MLRPLRTPTIPHHPSAYWDCWTRCSSSDNGRAVKYMNFANKTLFGAVVSKKKPVKESSTSSEKPELNKYTSEKQSEMYWLLQHEPAPVEVSRTTVKKKAKLIKQEPESVCEVKKRRVRSVKLKADPVIPSVLTTFTDSLCKPPRKHAKSGPAMKMIIGDEDRLREILTFPVFDLNKRSADDLNNVIGGHRLEMKQMPSVGKILQATMPEAARRALMQWKLLKIAELGEEGFHILQQCESK